MTSAADSRTHAWRRPPRWPARAGTVGLLLGLLALAPPTPVAAQPSKEAGDGVEVTALRRSLDQIVVLLRQLVDQSSRRDTAALLMSRIEMAERRMVPAEAELRALRERRLAASKDQLGLQASFRSIDDMQKLDVTGSARDAFDAERQRVSVNAAQKESELAEIDRQIAAVEADLGVRRRAIAGMDEQLDRLLNPR